MAETKRTLGTEIEETMACTAYAEAGEPCPIGSGETTEREETLAAAGETIEETMACAAYAEAGEPCPLEKTETN